ncbi:peroxiredoxin Q/BCP [Paenibacillus shirakamiensis]|uniref:thioredoxin-dependent peroxiredoxin n=1 Tax=Paenibacillus shirakamiensis TaxID=1265935 RepID=A0ABS4JHV3_9BACL|nr:peroxiredoxin [Paenibacillus shirakamiensis]MBP2001300.1 peroxiredoxin Q/BCP [Paenibacillus shirakamiensis]
MLKVGCKAPVFEADSTKGHIHLQEVIGKQPIVLIFYPMDDTPGCTKQLCAVRDAEPSYSGYGALVLGVNPGTKESHEKFAAKHGYDFPLVSDTDNQIRSHYDVGKTLGILTQQRVVYVIGLDGNIAFAEKGLRATDEILGVLKTMTA